VSRVVERDRGLSEQLRDVPIDALIDLVSYTQDEFNANAAILKPRGRAASALRAAGEGANRTNVAAAPTAENLARVSALLADGAVRIPIQRTHRIEDAETAVQEFAAAHKQGKHALVIS